VYHGKSSASCAVVHCAAAALLFSRHLEVPAVQLQGAAAVEATVTAGYFCRGSRTLSFFFVRAFAEANAFNLLQNH